MPALTPGTRLGPYEILAAIGAGGMGEVYRGRDTRLDRIVAIKVLASSLAADPQSRERFEREAKAISSLNHPNICALYDVGRERPAGDAGDVEPPIDFLVMEYVAGETLTARLARATSGGSRDAIGVPEALTIAIQIAAALDRAHRQGIVHRDLKPGNVMLSKESVKLLDFGLARLSRAGTTSESKAGLGHGLVSLADLSMPTVSSPLTMKGTILGTLQYMSPEQLEGKEVDARADIFAFGGVLYEMLTGRRPFEGKSQASLIGAILDHQPPPVTSFQPVSPPMLDEIVARCLAKEPDDRWQSARDLKRQLEWVAKQVSEGAQAMTAAVGGAQVAPLSVAARITRISAAILAGAVLAGAGAWRLWPQALPAAVPTRFSVELPTGQAFTRFGRHVVALSPDAASLVYVANEQLYLRKMGELTAVPISGTEKSNPSEPIFSPDGQWIAFWSDPELKKVPITGGTPVALATVGNPFGGSWIGDRILLGQGSDGIVEVPANGGSAKVLVSVEKGEIAHGPQLISGGKSVLFSLLTGGAGWDDAVVVVHELATGRRTVVVNRGTDARLMPTGHLMYFREATLFAMPFDEQRLTPTGGPVPVQPGVQQAPQSASGAAQAAWSDAGVMAFVPGAATAFDREFVYLTRRGQEEPTTLPARDLLWTANHGLALSPDGTRAAVVVIDGNARRDIWVGTVARGGMTRLTFTGAATSPVWTPDGRRICYVQADEALCQNVDGGDKPQPLFKFPGLDSLDSLSPDGTRLVFMRKEIGAPPDIMIATLGSPIEIRPLIKTAFGEYASRISPDGRWIAYASDESGRLEVYVRPFPNVDQGRWQVSTDGGTHPRWAKDGRELVFSWGGNPNRTFWSSVIQPGTSFVAGKPVQIPTSARTTANASTAYDIAPDGRLLVSMPLNTGIVANSKQVVVVQHWFDELKARVPAAARRD